MSRTFRAVAIYVTTGPATDLDHDGNPFTFKTLPEGSTLCIDTRGDLFIAVSPMTMNSVDDWQYHRPAKSRELYRDYWKCLLTKTELAEIDQVRKLSPVARSIRAAPRKLLWGTDTLK